MRDTRELRQYLHPVIAILIPAGQAVVSAVAAWVTVGSVAWVYQADNPIAAGGVAAGVTFGVSWVLALGWWRARVEGAGGNLEPMGSTAEVVYPAEVVRVELEKPDQGQMWVDYLDLPFDRDLIIRAAAYLRERNYETSNLGGASKPLTRSKAEAIRDWMISNDLAAWIRPGSPTVGWGILPAGRRVLRRLHHLGISTGVVDPPPQKTRVITQADIYARMQSHTNPQIPPAFPAPMIMVDHDHPDDQDVINDLWR